MKLINGPFSPLYLFQLYLSTYFFGVALSYRPFFYFVLFQCIMFKSLPKRTVGANPLSMFRINCYILTLRKCGVSVRRWHYRQTGEADWFTAAISYIIYGIKLEGMVFYGGLVPRVIDFNRFLRALNLKNNLCFYTMLCALQCLPSDHDNEPYMVWSGM